MINLQFKTQRELESFIIKIATPIAQKIAKQEAASTVEAALHFRAKVDVAAPTSGLQAQQKSSGALLLSGGVLTGDLTTANIGFYGTAASAKQTAVGSKGGNVALASVIGILVGLGLINDLTT